jgi:hypothetical protein
MEMKVVDVAGKKMLRIRCQWCWKPTDWGRDELIWARDHSRRLCCSVQLDEATFDQALKLLDEAETEAKSDETQKEKVPSRGWSFRARLEDIDIARVCREAEAAGLECIEVGCPRSPDIGTRVLIRRELCSELRAYPHASDVDYLGSPRGLHRGIGCVDGVDTTNIWWGEEGPYEWVQLFEHSEPVTATRASELLHGMRMLRDERLRCVVRAVGVNDKKRAS